MFAKFIAQKVKNASDETKVLFKEALLAPYTFRLARHSFLFQKYLLKDPSLAERHSKKIDHQSARIMSIFMEPRRALPLPDDFQWIYSLFGKKEIEQIKMDSAIAGKVLSDYAKNEDFVASYWENIRHSVFSLAIGAAAGILWSFGVMKKVAGILAMISATVGGVSLLKSAYSDMRNFHSWLSDFSERDFSRKRLSEPEIA